MTPRHDSHGDGRQHEPGRREGEEHGARTALREERGERSPHLPEHERRDQERDERQLELERQVELREAASGQPATQLAEGRLFEDRGGVHADRRFYPSHVGRGQLFARSPEAVAPWAAWRNVPRSCTRRPINATSAPTSFPWRNSRRCDARWWRAVTCARR